MSEQMEFDFGDKPFSGRVATSPATQYFREAFASAPTQAEIDKARKVAERMTKLQADAVAAKTLGIEYSEPRRVTGEPTPKERQQMIDYLKVFPLVPPGALVKKSEPQKTNAPILSTDSAERKNTPIFSGVLMYFPLAIAAVARHSKRGNDKHNAGEPLHWAREKSTDHLDCAVRHIIDANHFNAELGEYEEACALAWRALAHLQLLEESRLNKK